MTVISGKCFFPKFWHQSHHDGGNLITIRYHPPETMDLVHPAKPTCFLYKSFMSTLPETNNLPLTMNGWKAIVSFWDSFLFEAGYLTPCPYFYNWELALWRFTIESRQCRWTKICLNVERITFRNSVSQFEQWSKPRSWLGYLRNITEIYGLWWATVRIPMNQSVQWLLLVWTGNAKKTFNENIRFMDNPNLYTMHGNPVDHHGFLDAIPSMYGTFTYSWLIYTGSM